MNEFFEFRIPKEYAIAHLPTEIKGQMSKNVITIRTKKQDSLYQKIISLQKMYYSQEKSFFFGWNIIRKYSKEEINQSDLLHGIIKKAIYSCGEENGTIYDESTSCSYCGAGGIQKTELILSETKIPEAEKTDIWKTYGGEIGVSTKFARVLTALGHSPDNLAPIRKRKNPNEFVPGWLQLKISPCLYQIAPQTLAGINPFEIQPEFYLTNQGKPNFDKVTGSFCDTQGNHTCPLGDTIGLNLLSEIFVFHRPEKLPLSWTEQCVGVRRGVLRPEHCLIINSDLRRSIQHWGIKGFNFERVHQTN
jgi:hypothetical protein